MMLLILTLIGWLAGIPLFWRNRCCTADDSDRSATHPREWANLAVVIPARDEQRSLPTLLASISAQSLSPTEVIVVDDGSRDATASLARQAGATVISSASLPEGWTGKTWACWQGAQSASAEHLLFLDADTWFESDGLAKIMRDYQRQPGVLSVLPYHVVPSPAEQLSAFFNVVMAVGTGGFCPLDRAPDGLFGQMLLIRRDAYFAAGGHEAVRQYVLENFHFMRVLARQGAAGRLALGRGSLSMRMYPDGLSAIVRGWAKGFRSGAGATARFVMLLTIAWLGGCILAPLLAIEKHDVTGSLIYLLFVGQILVMLRRLGSYRFITALLYPVGLIFFFCVFGSSFGWAGRNVQWKGRAVRAA